MLNQIWNRNVPRRKTLTPERRPTFHLQSIFSYPHFPSNFLGRSGRWRTDWLGYSHSPAESAVLVVPPCEIREERERENISIRGKHSPHIAPGSLTNMKKVSFASFDNQKRDMYVCVARWLAAKAKQRIHLNASWLQGYQRLFCRPRRFFFLLLNCSISIFEKIKAVLIFLF